MKKHLIVFLCLAMALSSVVIISASAKTCPHNGGWDRIIEYRQGDCNHYNWIDAICALCKTEYKGYTHTYGPHAWVYNGCEQPMKCKYTNHRDAKGTVVHHDWTTATCTAPSHCTKCKQVKGTTNPNNHAWVGGNCTTAAHCSRCNQQGSKDPNNHYVNTATGKCYRCKKQLFTPKK